MKRIEFLRPKFSRKHKTAQYSPLHPHQDALQNVSSCRRSREARRNATLRDVHPCFSADGQQPGQAAGRFACAFFEACSELWRFFRFQAFLHSPWVALGPFARFVEVI
jgi:hypothetical protein